MLGQRVSDSKLNMFSLVWVAYVFVAVAFIVSLFCSPELNDRSYYSSKSRATFGEAINERLEPHNYFIVGARATLVGILNDACLQGTKSIALWSRLSESGFIALGRLAATERFESFVADLKELDAFQFGDIFARDNEGLINNYNRRGGKVACTFRDLMKTGKCTYNGHSFNVTNFKLERERSRHYYEFCAAVEFCHISHQVPNNLILSSDEVREWLSAHVHAQAHGDDKRRDHLYNHNHTAGMFHFGVYFDGIEQARYSAPGQGEHMSKVLHWDVTRSQLISDLFEKGFEFGSTQEHNLPAVTVNETAFEGYPSSFVEVYKGSAYGGSGNRCGVMCVQRLDLRLWEANPKNSFLDIMKNEPTWKTAAHKR